MRVVTCDHCGQVVFFHDDRCHWPLDNDQRRGGVVALTEVSPGRQVDLTVVPRDQSPGTGLTTLDLSETDLIHPDRVRNQLGESYRTLLGHFRHEIGHYYWSVLVWRDDVLNTCRALFDDDRADYSPAVSRAARGLQRRRTTSASTPRCSPRSTGPSPSRTTCTSTTPSRPPRAFASVPPARGFRPPSGR